jgi:hypothetical protein
MSVKQAFTFFILLALAACSTVNDTAPQRSATEEMLISTAADRAAEKLTLALPKKDKVFVDASNVDGTDAKYAVATIRAHLLQKGIRLVDDKKAAHTIVELRAGALSIDKSQNLIGIPSFNIPIPLSTTPLSTPEVALYKNDDQKGVAKFAIIAYDAKQGKLISSEVPQYGYSHKTKRTVLIFFTWTDNDAAPEDNSDATANDVKQVAPADD